MTKFLNFLSKLIATFFGIGFTAFAAGTFGSIAALLILLIIFYQPFNFYITDNLLNYEVGGGYINQDYIIYIIVIADAILYPLGVWASERYSKLINDPDPKKIVIDEVSGMFTAASLTALIYAGLIKFYDQNFILYLTKALWFFVIIFLLFRFFDIAKPWHIGKVQKNVKGGQGIMLDDQIAAIYSVIVFYIGFSILYFTGVLDKVISVE